MGDPFQFAADAAAAPATRVAAVVPSDTVPLSDTPKALYVGTGGSLSLTGVRGGEATFANLPDGSVVPVRARLVRASGTTARDIVGLY